MKIRFIESLFDKSCVEVFDVDYRHQTIGDYFDQVIGRGREGYAPIISGRRGEWDEIPCLDDELIFTQDLQEPVSMSAIFAAIGTWLATNAITLVVGFLVSALVGFAMSYLFKPELPKDNLNSSPTYSWDGIKNVVGEGTTMGVVYGRHRVAGVVVEAFIDGEKRAGRQKYSYLHALLALSEGPVEEIQTNTIQINDQPLDQYKAVKIESRVGGKSQLPLEYFSQIVRQYNLTGVQLKHGSGPWIYTLNGDYIKRAVVNLVAPGGLYEMSTDGDGDLWSLGVDHLAYYQDITAKPGDPYYDWTARPGQPAFAPYWHVQGRSRSALNFSLPFDFPYPGQWRVKIERVTVDHTDPKYGDQIMISSVKEYEAGQLTYPHTALLGVRIRATDRLSGMMPTISVVVKGRKLYDVRTGVFAWSDNPANIIYDILSNRRYGLGKKYGVTQEQYENPHDDSKCPKHIDMVSLRKFADYCDELITYKYYDPTDSQADADGYVTTTEQRFNFNVIYDQPGRAMDVINKICGSCRSKGYWEGSRFKVVPEKASEPVQLFNMGNIVKDSYSEDYTSLSDVPNVVEAYILDETNNWKREPVTGVDRRRVNEPTNNTEINLFGLTRMSRAQREVVFAMSRAKAILKSITFQAGIEAVVVSAGDVFLFQHDVPKYGMAGGQVLSVSGNTVTLDRTVPLVAGREYVLRIRRNFNNQQLAFYFKPSVGGLQSVIDIGQSAEAIPIRAQDLYVIGEGLNIGAGTIQDRIGAVVTLDQPVPMTSGKLYSLRVTKTDGNFAVHTFMADSTGSTNILKLIVTDVFQWGAGRPYVFGEITKEAKAFTANALVRKDNKNIEITADEYNPAIFTDDGTIKVVMRKKRQLNKIETFSVDGPAPSLPAPVTLLSEEDDTSGGPLEIPPYVTDITLTEIPQDNEDLYGSNIEVSFAEVDMPDNAQASIVRYDIWYSIDDGDRWVVAGSCKQGPYTFQAAKIGQAYNFLVKPYTNYGRTNDHELCDDYLDYEITPTGEAPPWAIVQPAGNFACNSTPFANELSWSKSSSVGIKYYEVWCAVDQNDRTAASVVAQVTGTSFSHGNLNPDSHYYYWIVAVNRSGSKSIFCPGAKDEPPPGFTPGIHGYLASFDGGTF